MQPVTSSAELRAESGRRDSTETSDVAFPEVETIRSEGARDVRLFLSPSLPPDAETRKQLTRLARTPGLAHYVVALPDLHRKSRNVTPTGTVVVTRDVIVPRAVDTGIGCGMRILPTDLDAAALDHRALDALFLELRRLVPVKEHTRPIVSAEDVGAILVWGGQWSNETFDQSESELDKIEDRASARLDVDPEAMLAAIPSKAIEKGRKRFATLGAGNHFFELQEIVEILDAEVADDLDLVRGTAVFMLHTDSRSVVKKILAGMIEALEAQVPGSDQIGLGFPTIPVDSEAGRSLRRVVAASTNFGFANRIALTVQLRRALRQVFGDESANLRLLYDCAHVSIKPERWNGEKLWIHRHGASHALPRAQSTHPIFSETGQPVPIPGSMGHDSFIGVADDTSRETFFSVNHGAGRTIDKPEARAQFSQSEIEGELRSKGIRLYRYGVDNIAEQAPGSFKDIDEVVSTMAAHGLARPVARLRPIAVLKG